MTNAEIKEAIFISLCYCVFAINAYRLIMDWIRKSDNYTEKIIKGWTCCMLTFPVCIGVLSVLTYVYNMILGGLR